MIKFFAIRLCICIYIYIHIYVYRHIVWFVLKTRSRINLQQLNIYVNVYSMLRLSDILTYFAYVLLIALGIEVNDARYYNATFALLDHETIKFVSSVWTLTIWKKKEKKNDTLNILDAFEMHFPLLQ